MNTPVKLWTPPRERDAGGHAYHQARPTLHLRAGMQVVSQRVGTRAARGTAAVRISVRKGSNHQKAVPVIPVDATYHR